MELSAPFSSKTGKVELGLDIIQYSIAWLSTGLFTEVNVIYIVLNLSGLFTVRLLM